MAGTGRISVRFLALVLSATLMGCVTGKERRATDAGATDDNRAGDGSFHGSSGDASHDPGGPSTSSRVCRLSSEPAFDAGADAAPACHDVPAFIFGEVCSGGICHHAGSGQAAHLDLESPCVADRLVGVASTCMHEPLVDPNDPDGGFLLEKLSATKPKCGGASMPYGNHLPARELACVRKWVTALVHEASPL
jgi:hypothetical protein